MRQERDVRALEEAQALAQRFEGMVAAKQRDLGAKEQERRQVATRLKDMDRRIAETTRLANEEVRRKNILIITIIIIILSSSSS
jgi:hypothetical protein